MCCAADKRLSKTDPGKQWVDRRGNVKQGTHLIFNVSPDFELHGEGAQHLIPTSCAWQGLS